MKTSNFGSIWVIITIIKRNQTKTISRECGTHQSEFEQQINFVDAFLQYYDWLNINWLNGILNSISTEQRICAA